MTVSFAGAELPSMAGFRTAMLVASGVAALAAVLALLIPVAPADVAAVGEPAEAGRQRS